MILYIECVILLISAIGAKHQVQITEDYSINLGIMTFIMVHLGLYLVFIAMNLIDIMLKNATKKQREKELKEKELKEKELKEN